MSHTRECPLCGGTMQLRRTEQIVRIPGHPQAQPQIATEWICPDCDYFEDVEDAGT